MNDESIREIADKLNSEIRRGSLVLAVLGQLQSEHYGYSLRKSLAEHGLDVEEGTLYPLIRRLEKQGLLESEWREENKRRKRFYRLSAVGQSVYASLLEDWRDLSSSLTTITASGSMPQVLEQE
ncbi:MAG: PadR family transcriptional regulator [Pseudomonadales bacterium]|nr:PadR family transcriptional regulator [Pseudomonadales bacterium]